MRQHHKVGPATVLLWTNWLPTISHSRFLGLLTCSSALAVSRRSSKVCLSWTSAVTSTAADACCTAARFSSCTHCKGQLEPVARMVLPHCCHEISLKIHAASCMRPCMRASSRCILVGKLKLGVKGTTGSLHLQLPAYMVQPSLKLMLQVLHTILAYADETGTHNKVRS